MDKHVKAVEKLDRNELIKGNKKDTPINTRIPFAITYDRFLPIVSEIIRTKIKRNKDLKELIGSNKNEHTIVKRLNESTLKLGKCSPCFGNSRTLCSNQVITILTFKSQQTQKTYEIFHEVNSSSTYVKYLMKCTLCKPENVGKAETPFNIRLNNHRKNMQNSLL